MEMVGSVLDARQPQAGRRLWFMRSKPWTAVPLLAASLVLAPLRVWATEIWLGGFDPVMRSILQGSASDYYAMFEPDAPWPRAASHLNVFQITGSLAGGGPEDELRRIFTDLQRRKIALALEIAPLTATRECGQRVEGSRTSGEVARLVQRIRRLGGDLRYVAMDGPLSAGHIYSGANACRTSVPALAQEVAATVNVIRQAFPAAKVGDIERIGFADPPDLINQIVQWTEAYKHAVGEPPAFLRTDMLWSGPWRQQLARLEPRLPTTAGIELSIIYNGDGSDLSGLAWTNHAEQRFADIETDPA